MVTLEKSMKTTATEEDLKVIKLIIHQFEYFDGYYGKLCKLRFELKYKEFSTLREDFKQFADTIELCQGTYPIKELYSLKRSLMLLSDVYQNNYPIPNNLYLNFLNDSISNLDNWVEAVINEISESVV